MNAIYSCISEGHDRILLLIAALVCSIGVYASFSVAQHAGRLDGCTRTWWSVVAIVAAGSTAWATHMIALLAFRPGMLSGFDPVMTAASLILTIVGIGTAVGTAISTRHRSRRLISGFILGLSITLLHHLGQSAYLVTGQTGWNDSLVALSILLSMPLICGAMVFAGERRRGLRHLAAPSLVIGIAILHFTGMTALQLQFDPSIDLPPSTLSPDVIAPIVASVGAGLLVLAVHGLRFSLAARVRLRSDELRLKQLADMAVEGLLICENDTVQAMNNSLASLSGYAKDRLAGVQISSVLPNLAISEIAEQEEIDAELLRADGKLVPVRVLRKTVALGSRHQTIVAVRDQSERLTTERKLHTLAYSDALTGLSNRVHFNQLLEVTMKLADSDGKSFALLLLDLDRFKSVNDTLGHLVGDELLKRVASRICATVDAADIVARLGGDEFAVIVHDESRAEMIAGTIIELLGRPFLIEASVIEVAGSIGVATARRDGHEPGTLYRHADLALYAAKQDGGATSRKFEAGMSDRAKARRLIELDLRRALTREEFAVHYQPQVDPKSGRYQGAEALVRWRHPTRGMVSPADFIPLAEEIGLIGALGEWVLRTACEEAMGWPRQLSVAVNLSPVQLRDSNIASTVAHILQETGLPATRLELEITESALMQDEDTTYRTLQSLRKMGIRISMDDFGTGYSSLRYLQRFPFTKIKIDQSFVRQLPDNPDAVAIVQAITSLAGKLRMTVTAEGVETMEQRAFTVIEGCDQIQGYLISRPLEQTAIRALFTATEKAVA